MIVSDSPPPIVVKNTTPTTTEKVALAALSFVDIVQTENLLTQKLPKGWTPGYEEDPLLGRHPSLGRMAATGVAIDEAILHVRSPFIRRFAIGIELGNVTRNFTIGMKL